MKKSSISIFGIGIFDLSIDWKSYGKKRMMMLELYSIFTLFQIVVTKLWQVFYVAIIIRISKHTGISFSFINTFFYKAYAQNQKIWSKMFCPNNSFPKIFFLLFSEYLLHDYSAVFKFNIFNIIYFSNSLVENGKGNSEGSILLNNLIQVIGYLWQSSIYSLINESIEEIKCNILPVVRV